MVRRQSSKLRSRPYVALAELEVGPLLGSAEGFDFIRVPLVAGGEVVQAHYLLVQLAQSFQQAGANEAGLPVISQVPGTAWSWLRVCW